MKTQIVGKISTLLYLECFKIKHKTVLGVQTKRDFSEIGTVVVKVFFVCVVDKRKIGNRFHVTGSKIF